MLKIFSGMPYLYSASVVLLLSWALSGCRFGNRVEYGAGPKTRTGFYTITPQSLQFCGQLSTSSQSQCGMLTPTLIPAPVGEIFTNPSALRMEDPVLETATIFSPVYMKGIEVQFTGPTAYNTQFQSAPQVLWADPLCTFEFYIDAAGDALEGPAGNVAGIPTKGALTSEVNVIYDFNGQCTAALSAIRLCVQDQGPCAGPSTTTARTDAQVAATFRAAVQSGAITGSQIVSVQTLGFHVSYR